MSRSPEPKPENRKHISLLSHEINMKLFTIYLVDVKDDVIRAVHAPEHPGVWCVVPHHHALLAMRGVIKLLDPGLVRGGIHRAPGGVRGNLDGLSRLLPLGTRAPVLLLWALTSGPLSVPARTWSPLCNYIDLHFEKVKSIT